MKEKTHNFWQLTCLTGTALGLPAMVIGGQLAQQYGAGTALISVIMGNFILWIIGLGIISMAEGRNHAIENIREYLGKGPSLFAAIIFMCSFLIWYSLQIQGASSAVSGLVENENPWKLGVVFGLLVAGMGIGGIRLITKVCVIALPLLVCFAIYAMAVSG